MNRKLTTALAILLFAGASGAAMAQDRDHGDRGQSQPQAHPQPQHASPPPGAREGGGHFSEHPGGPPRIEGAPRGAAPGEHLERAGPPPGVVRGHEGPPPGAFRGHEERGPQGPGGPERFNREGGPVPGVVAPRQFDRDRGPAIVPGAPRGRDVVPGGRFEGRPDVRGEPRVEIRPGGGHVPLFGGSHGAPRGREVVPGGRFEGRPDVRGDARTETRPGFRAPLFGGSHGAPPHWQPGRYPPVMWSHDRFRAGYYRPPYGYYSRAWVFGDFLPRPWFVRDYWLDDFLDFDLPYPPPGFIWVRVGPDALMIDRFTGRIVQVVHGIFW